MNKLRETEASRKYNAHKRQCKRNYRYRIANTRRVMKLRVDDWDSTGEFWMVARVVGDQIYLKKISSVSSPR